MLRRILFAAVPAALLASAPVCAAELPPLDATVSYESRSVSHAGVTEIRQFRNLLIRRPGHVWMERLVPAHVEAGHTHEVGEGGHKHVDFDLSTQHLTRGARGEVHAEYIDPNQRQVVFVPPTEYSISGFDGSWDNAAAMVAEKTVLAMPLSSRASPTPEAHWHEEARNGWYNRVLWSSRYKVALIVESGRTDGSTTRRTVLDVRPLTAEQALPWKHLNGYAQKEYDDFMD